MSLTKVTYSMISGAPANVLDFGADITGVADSTAAFTLAFATGRLVYAPAGTYRLNNPSYTVQLNSGLVGDGRSTILKVYGATTPDRNVDGPFQASLAGALLTGAGGNLFRDFVIQAGDIFDYTKTYESWTEYNYTANNHIVGIDAGSDTMIENVHCIQLYIPIGGIGKSNINIEKCSSDRSAFAAIWTAACSKIAVNMGSWDRCGYFGGIVFSNALNVSVSNNAWLFNPESTGIDFGGGVTADSYVAITGNSILAGDAIGIENGGRDITITGNQVCVAGGYVTFLDLTGINTQLHAGALNTVSSNVVISGNSICWLDPNLQYVDFIGTGVDIGSVDGSQSGADITISGNMIRGGESSIYVHGLSTTPNSNIAITGNNCTHNFYGIKIEDTDVGFVSGNAFVNGKPSTTAGTYGIFFPFGDVSNVVFSSNMTMGYDVHIQQDIPGTPTNLNCGSSVMQSHTFMANPNDFLAYTTVRNSGTGTSLNVRPLNLIQNVSAITYSTNNITLGNFGGSFAATATTQIDLISNVGWQDGTVIRILFQAGATTVRNGIAASGVFRTLNLATGANYVSGAAGLGVLSLMYDQTGNVWREIARVG